MNTPFEKLSSADDQLWLLVETFCDGDVTTAERDALDARLAADPAARRFYLAYLQTHAELAWQRRGQIDPIVPASPRPTVPSSRSPVLSFLASISRHVPGGEFTVGSLILLVLVAAFWGLSQAILYPRLGGHDLAHDLSPLAPDKGRGAGGEGHAVATITETSEVEWSSLTPASTRGERADIAANQPLQLTSGLIELQLKQGTTLLIEGPADWQITGNNSATLTHGKLVAKVPREAVGFTLETPTAKIVDLGTEFAVEVDSKGDGTLQVLQGVVEASKRAEPSALPSEKPLRVTTGQAVRISRGQEPISVTTPRHFVRDITTREPEQIQGSYATAILADGPVGYWRFSDGFKAIARDASGHKRDGKYLGVIHPRQPGIEPQSADHSIRLTGEPNYGAMELSVPIAASFSAEAWVKSATPQWKAAGWIACARSKNGFILHPQPGPNRQWTFYVYDATGAEHLVGSHCPERIDDKFHHYVCAYDHESDTAVMYFDGEAVKTTTPLLGTHVRSDSSTLKCWVGCDQAHGIPGSGAAIGNGWIDEFAIYDQALTAKQVRTHFEAAITE